MDFFTNELKNRLEKVQKSNKNKNKNRWLKIKSLIDWKEIEEELNQIYEKKEEKAKGGNTPYEPIKMFKAILLQQWHNLSDVELEEALEVRVDFIIFTELGTSVPDESTICRFRNLLIKKGLLEKLLEKINKQLESKNIKVKRTEGAIIDATVIESANRPDKQIIINTEETANKNEENKEDKIEIEYSKDKEASWTKKGGKYYYGYKGHVMTEAKDGFIEKVEVTTAKESDTKHLKDLIDKDEKIEKVYADKGYASKENRDILKSNNIEDGIMLKKDRGEKMSEKIKGINKAISKIRFIIERSFGSIKRQFNFHRTRYKGILKVKGQFLLKAICYNLSRAINKVEILN